MEELIMAILAGLAAGVLIKNISDKAKSVPIFKKEKITNSDDILAEAKKAKDIGADSASILLAFGAIESRLRDISGHDSGAYPLNSIITLLLDNNSISKDTALTIKQLAKIRNETAHGVVSKKLSNSKVDSYLEKTKAVLDSISNSSYSKASQKDA